MFLEKESQRNLPRYNAGELSCSSLNVPPDTAVIDWVGVWGVSCLQCVLQSVSKAEMSVMASPSHRLVLMTGVDNICRFHII